MTDNVVALPGYAKPAPLGPVQEVIDILRNALVEAESGNMRALAIASVMEDGQESHILGAKHYAVGGSKGDLLLATGVLVRMIERDYDQIQHA